MYPRNFDKYVLLERIGAGGMSEIDLARRVVEDTGFMRFLVIKRIKAERNEDEAFVRMFKDEARISAELHHTNIAQVYDFGRVDDEFFLVLEYVPGIDVRRILNVCKDREAHVPLRITLRIICDLLSGLHYAHTRTDMFGKPMNVVHRDVNPRNIMVSLRGDVKLIDFGVAKAEDRLERTHTDHVKGKFAYMAPEQVSAKEIDGRVDVFAAALTLHEMVAGVGPFYGLNQVQIMHRLMAGQVPELPAHSDLADMTALRRVQRKALATKPDERYLTADAYRKDLERVAERIGGLANTTELAAFVATIEPDFDKRLRDKAALFSGPVEALPTTMELPGIQVQPAIDTSGSMSKASQVTYTNITARQAGVAAMGTMAMLTIGVSVVLVLLLAIGGSVIAWQQGWFGTSATAHGVSDEPSLNDARVPPTDVPTLDTPPSDTPPSDPAAGASDPPPSRPSSTNASDAPRSSDGAPSASSSPATTATTASGSASSGTEAALVTPPGTTDAATSRVDITPVPPASSTTTAPPADAVAPGTLQVTSVEKGRKIYVNGTDTGQVTPARVSAPPGKVTVKVDGYEAQTVDVVSKAFAAVKFQ